MIVGTVSVSHCQMRGTPTELYFVLAHITTRTFFLNMVSLIWGYRRSHL